MESLPQGSFCVVIGMINTGKTSVCRRYVRSHPDLTGFVVHPAGQWERRYTDFLPASQVCEGDIDSEDVLRELIAMPLRKLDYVIFDGCLWDPEIYSGNAIHHLVEHCARCGITMIITMSYAMGLTEMIRAAVTHTIVLREGLLGNIRRIHELYSQWYIPPEELISRVHHMREVSLATNQIGYLLVSEDGVREDFIPTST